jgi:DNA repair protein RAD50
VKDKRARELEDCASNIEQYELDIQQLNQRVEESREVVKAIDKEINASGASLANYRENIRVRKLAKDIRDTQAEIDSHDMEEAARARRNFEAKYGPAKEKENTLHTSVSPVVCTTRDHAYFDFSTRISPVK